MERKHKVPNAMTLTPQSVLLLFLDDTFWDTLVEQTNLYANSHPSVIQQKIQRTSHHQQWKDVDVPIMKSFFGQLMAMGLNRKPAIECYWSSKRVYKMHFFGEVMPVDRFKDVLRYLHYVDNDSYDDVARKRDSLWKIRPFLNLLSTNFTKYFYPGTELSIDEGTCAFKGRVKFRAYNPNKPHKWGIKIYQVCDAVTGYCCRFKVAADESTTTYELVLNLMDNYLGKGHELYVDRFHSSPRLFQDLYAKNTVAVGTCMNNRRSLSKQCLKEKLKRRETIARRQGALMALKWRDKREVLMLSTKHTPTMETVTRNAHGPCPPKDKPTAVICYNSYMMGVDKSDQMLQYYDFNRKTVKW